MKKLVLVTLTAVMGFMLLVPSFGYSDPVWKRNQQRPQYAFVRDHDPHYYRPAPVRHYDPRVRYVEERHVQYVERHDDDRSGQVAVAALGGIVVGALLGTV
ncbi:MAG: hypothetical protein ACYDHW_16670, partial [Syntrophorhabdaceae bacterium]